MRCRTLWALCEDPMVREHQCPFVNAIWLNLDTRIFGERMVVMQACTEEKKDRLTQIMVQWP